MASKRLSGLTKRAWLMIGAASLALVASVVAGVLAMRVEVPQLEGLSVADAEATLEAAGLEWDRERVAWARQIDERFQVVKSQEPEAGSVVWRGDSIDVTMEPMSVRVPELSGLSFAQASAELDRVGLRIGAEFDDEPEAQSWEVVAQSLSAGTEARAGELVSVVLEVPMVVVPELLGLTLAEAGRSLDDLGLLMRSDFAASAEDDWEVVGQAPGAGESIKFGDWIDLQVLPPVIEVPSVVGLGRDEAVRTLEEAGFIVQVSPDASEYDWAVASQSPGAGAGAREGATVSLSLREPRIVFEVTGNGSRALITWTIPGNSFSIGQESNARLPWSKSFPITSGYRGNLSAQMMNGSSITCTIRVNGRVVEQVTSTGAYAIALCG